MSDLHVVFGTGALGLWTARELVRLGKTVRMVNRSGRARRIPEGVELVAADASDSASNIQITRGAAAIYQCAMPAYARWAKDFPPLLHAILEAAIANSARLVVGDNLYMYGKPQGILREDSPVTPITRKGRLRAGLARDVQQAHASGKVQAVIGRASDFFGPEDNYLTRYTILPAVRGKTASLLGRRDQPHSFTYIVDFGRLLATLGVDERAPGQVWFAPTNPPLTQAEFVQQFAAEPGSPVKTLTAAPWLLRGLGMFDATLRETAEMMYEWTAPFVIDSSKASKTFGLEPTPFPQAVRETIQWCKELDA